MKSTKKPSLSKSLAESIDTIFFLLLIIALGLPFGLFSLGVAAIIHGHFEYSWLVIAGIASAFTLYWMFEGWKRSRGAAHTAYATTMLVIVAAALYLLTLTPIGQALYTWYNQLGE